MTATELTLDDLLYHVFGELLKLPFDTSSTRGQTDGNVSEIFGALLHLENPRARLSRTETKGTVFSALGELLWYLSGSDKLDFIKYYIKDYESESEDGEALYGAYGPRLMSSQSEHNQIQNVINLLQEKPTSRRAVMQLFEARDIAGKPKKEIPCTCSLQFVIRHNQLQLMVHMRSNDVFKGLPHDIFAFTMLQEIIARTLGTEIGTYHHSVGSLHLYKVKEHAAMQYVNEGLQSTKKYMPSMPEGDPWEAINTLLEVESCIRTKKEYSLDNLALDPYWLDLIYLLEIYAAKKSGDLQKIQHIREKMSSRVYDTYIEKMVLNLKPPK